MRTSLSSLILVATALLPASPSLAADRVRVVQEGGLRDDWIVAKGTTLTAPAYPSEFASRGDSVCVAVGYLVRRDGGTSDYALLKAWSSSTGTAEPLAGYWDGFAQAAAHALSQWKFAPREGRNPEPVFTVATMTFRGSTEAIPIGDRCRVADLAGLVREQKANRFYNGIGRHDLDRAQRVQESAQAARNAAALMGSGAN